MTEPGVGSDITLKYVKKRRAFGQTIGGFQNTRFGMAEMATKIQLARSFLGVNGRIPPLKPCNFGA